MIDLTNIFQMGWNHQLVYWLSISMKCRSENDGYDKGCIPLEDRYLMRIFPPKKSTFLVDLLEIL